jgi:hypothetical protein
MVNILSIVAMVDNIALIVGEIVMQYTNLERMICKCSNKRA